MNRNDYRVQIISDAAGLALCRDVWNELAGDRVFHRWEWMYHWWNAFGQGSRNRLAVVVIVAPSGRWVGVAPWYVTGSAARGRVVRQLASGSACSDYTSLAVRSGYESVVSRILAQVISGELPQEPLAGVDLFELEGHTADDPAVNALCNELCESAIQVVTEEFAGAWRSELPDTWAGYESRLHKSFRRKTRKAVSRLDNADFTAIAIHEPDEIAKHWTTFVELHQRRRESLGEGGCFADARFETFLRNATIDLAASGRSQINLFHHKGKPLATNLEFLAGDAVYMYQTGLDPDAIQLEPGHVTFTWAIQQSIERGFGYFDFLRGDEPYKSRWKSTRVPLYRTRVVPNRLAARFRCGVWSAGRGFRDWTRAVVGMTKLPAGIASSDSADDAV